MSVAKTVMTYFGGAVGVAGLALAASFIGRRTSDPFAESFLGPIPFVLQIVGVVAGLIVALLGFVVAVRLGDEEMIAQAMETDHE